MYKYCIQRMSERISLVFMMNRSYRSSSSQTGYGHSYHYLHIPHILKSKYLNVYYTCQRYELVIRRYTDVENN